MFLKIALLFFLITGSFFLNENQGFSKEKKVLKNPEVKKEKKKKAVITEEKIENKINLPEPTPVKENGQTLLIPLTSLFKQINVLTGHTNTIMSVAFSPDGKLLASAGSDNNIIIWDALTGAQINTLMGHYNNIFSIAFSPDGKTLASGSGDKSIILWDISTAKRIKTLTGHIGDVTSVAFHPDGKILATASGDQTIIIWDISTKQKIKILNKGHTDYIRSLAFSPNGKFLASCGDGDKDNIVIWGTDSFNKIKTLSGDKKAVFSIVFNPDGKFLVSGGADSNIIIWNLETGNQEKILKDHEEAIWSINFSNDGKLMASASEDRSIILWDGTNFEKINNITGHYNSVVTVAFSPVRTLLVSGSNDYTIILWDLLGMQFKALAAANNSSEKNLIEAKKTLYPFSFEIDVGKYNQGTEEFNFELFGQKIFVKVPPERGAEISKRKDFEKKKINIQGMVRYFDNQKAELLNAYLTDEISGEKFSFGKVVK